MEPDTFYVVQIQKNGKDIVAIDYPKDLPILIVGDNLNFRDRQGNEYIGKVVKRTIIIRDYREVNCVVDCT